MPQLDCSSCPCYLKSYLNQNYYLSVIMTTTLKKKRQHIYSSHIFPLLFIGQYFSQAIIIIVIIVHCPCYVIIPQTFLFIIVIVAVFWPTFPKHILLLSFFLFYWSHKFLQKEKKALFFCHVEWRLTWRRAVTAGIWQGEVGLLRGIWLWL